MTKPRSTPRATLAACLLGAVVATPIALAQTAEPHPRLTEPAPLASVAQAVESFRGLDPFVSVSWFNGHVDSFATRPKPSIPNYALPILQQFGLSTMARPLLLLPSPTLEPKPGQDLDADLSRKLPYPLEPATSLDGQPQPDDFPEGQAGNPILEQRTEPPLFLEPQRNPWQPPAPTLQQQESMAAQPILAAFLAERPAVFQVGPQDTAEGLPQLQLRHYSVGRYFRRAEFLQTLGGEPVLDSKTLVLFDNNWNVVSISRMIVTPQKLSVPLNGQVSRNQAAFAAASALEQNTGTPAQAWRDVTALRAVDAVRRRQLWKLRMVVPQDENQDVSVWVDAHTGEVLNLSDNVLYHNDAQVRRWGYTQGYLNQPAQYTSPNTYTRSDNTLVHDFFYMMNDERGGGTQSTCALDDRKDTLWFESAYGTRSGSDWIRATRRSDRDFSLWGPSASSGTFGESHTYYWARLFFQWMKPALNELGLLPTSSSKYQQVLIVTNACLAAGGAYNNRYDVTTLDDTAEGLPVIRLPEYCRGGNANCVSADYPVSKSGTFLTCEGNGCYTSPSVIHHEINHFLLKQYFGVMSDLDCRGGVELKFLHEGILGSAVPQAYWHSYYGVGYNPDTLRLYKANRIAGRVHTSDTTLLTQSNYSCTSDADPYQSGRVAGQALWKLYHGKQVNGSSITSTARPASDLDFLVLSYWAADLVSASTYKDRYEYANRVMQIMDLHSSMSSSSKGEWCNIWGKHQLSTYIDPAYCN